MTIKKLKTVKAAPLKPAAEGGSAPAEVSATIADRFKLDTTAPVEKGATVGKKAAAAALFAGLVALALAGIVTFVLFQHWEFLKNA